MTQHRRCGGIDRDSLVALDEYLATASRPATLEGRRHAWEQDVRTAAAVRSDVPAVDVQDLSVLGAEGHDIPVRRYTPPTPGEVSPAVLLIHGGGMIMGSLATEDLLGRHLCAALGAPVFSVGYRLAPENPYPAGLDDCLTAYQFLIDRYAGLGIDPHRIAVVGGSAGGGLALGLALRLRDSGGCQPRLVLAAYPMIDDRQDTDAKGNVPPVGVWDRSDNEEAWRLYLGGAPADEYAAPARATVLEGLPPIFLDVGDHDLFRDEVLIFAQRLTRASVATELHLYPGAFHASEEFAPEAALSLRIIESRLAALRRALELA